MQQGRFQRSAIHCNAQMNARQMRQHCHVDDQCHRLLRQAVDTLGLSARAYSRVLKVARTIADLADSAAIAVEHIAEAVQFRGLDRHRS